MKPIIIIVLFLFSCQTQKNKDTELIESFIKEIVLTEKKFSFSDTKKYLHYSKMVLEVNEEKYGDIETFIYEYIKMINEGLEEYNFNYKIISHKEAKKYSEANLTYYNRYYRVYHIVIDKKVGTSFIIENDKIISFCYIMMKDESSKRIPLLLNYDGF